MILPHLSTTFLSPTRSQSQISLLDGTPASATRPARHSLVNKGMGPAFMSRLAMAPRFQSSGGVCSSATPPYCARRLNPALAGNGIQLSGLVTGNITYDLELDGLTNSTVSPSSSGITLLAAYDNLQPTNHTLSLTVHNPTNSSSALIAIDHALIKVNSTSPKCVPRCLTCALRVHRILISPGSASLSPPPLLMTRLYRSPDAGPSLTTLRYLRWTVHTIPRVMLAILSPLTFPVRLPQP